MLKIYNSKTKKHEVFEPIKENTVGIYACGPTVYNDIHIGNARPIVFFDTVVRYLKHFYKEVNYVRNITDIDDKIINGAKEARLDLKTFTNKYIESYHQDIARLNTLKPTHEPKATDFIKEMVAMINTLIEKGYAYQAPNQDILFDTQKYKNYGKLSNLEKNEIIHGARIEVNKNKKYPADFALWKSVKKEEQGFESIFGYGRPGWHIECSAMAKHYLGDKFDIHGGGIDLIFPHHENELAQTVCSSSNPDASAKYWLHNGFLMVEGNKMSKSLGNFITLKNALEKNDGETIRLSLLSTHYRQPINYKQSSLMQSKNILNKIYKILAKYEDIFINAKSNLSDEFIKHMNDDFNTHLAINSTIQKVYSLDKNTNKKEAIEFIKGEGSCFGILNQIPSKWLSSNQSETTLSEQEINQLISQRNNAKLDKNFTKADEIRDFLAKNNIIIKDTKLGTTWEIKQ